MEGASLAMLLDSDSESKEVEKDNYRDDLPNTPAPAHDDLRHLNRAL